MTRLRSLFALLSLAMSCTLAAPWVHAQSAQGAAPAGAASAALPQVRLPELGEIRLPVPRPVQALATALGYGRQRLALVVGIGTMGSRLAIDSAPRDAQAVAAALQAAGFVVMLRQDIVGKDLRIALKEFRERLQPGGVGFAYFTGLAAQIDGQNLLLARDAALAGSAQGLAGGLRASGVPLQEVIDALMGTPESPRMLVVDAAYQHPALAGLPKPGLAEQKLPQGMMALFGHALGGVQEVPAVAPLPEPPPADPREIAASRFARVLVGALTTPRISGPEVLRGTQRAIADATLGQATPWLGGDTDAREEFAEATLLDSLLPRTPAEFARDAGKQGLSAARRTGGSRVGEQTVAEVLEQSAARPGTPQGGQPPTNDAAPQVPADAVRPPTPEPAAGGAGSVGSVLSTVGTVASAAGTLASVAVGARAAEAAAAVAAVTAAAGAAGSVVGNAVSTAARLGAGSASEQPARQAVSQLATPAPGAALTVPAANAPAAPVVPLVPAAGAAEMPADITAPIHIAPAAGAALSQVLAPDGRTARQAQGGERPIYAPRTNPFGYAEGDTFTYQVLDTWKGEVVGSYTTSIDEVLGDGHLLANGHQLQMDPQGRIKNHRRPDGSASQFTPVQELWWSNPKTGESRRVNFTERFQRAGAASGAIEFKGSASVGRMRKIETPAGEFEALPIETSGWFYETLKNGTLTSGQFSRTVWYSPKLGHPVAIDIQDADRLGKLLKRERVELMHAQQARATP